MAAQFVSGFEFLISDLSRIGGAVIECRVSEVEGYLESPSKAVGVSNSQFEIRNSKYHT